MLVVIIVYMFRVAERKKEKRSNIRTIHFIDPRSHKLFKENKRQKRQQQKERKKK